MDCRALLAMTPCLDYRPQLFNIIYIVEYILVQWRDV